MVRRIGISLVRIPSPPAAEVKVRSVRSSSPYLVYCSLRILFDINTFPLQPPPPFHLDRA